MKLKRGLTPARAAALCLAASVALLVAVRVFDALNFEPCPLCLRQREIHWLAAGVAVVALLLALRPAWSRLARFAVAALALVYLGSAAYAGWHAGIEYKWWPAPPCEAVTGPVRYNPDSLDRPTRAVPCDEAAWRLLGISLAGYNALISLVLAGAASAGALARPRGTFFPMIPPAPERRPYPRPPGDSGRARRVAEMIRVDHAGEYGAVAIYRGQRAVLARAARTRRAAARIAAMETQEQAHLDAFDALIAARGVRPTALAPLWNAAGFALGTATALIGEKAAHACTEAVEEVIEQHYARQIAELRAQGDEPELAETFARFREEELHHRDVALAEGAREAPAHALLTGIIKAGCRAAIRISEKI